MNKKHYEIPETELLFVKIEENFLQSDPNSLRKNSASSDYDDEEDLGEI